MLSSSEQRLTDEYLKHGFVIRSCESVADLDWIRSQFVEFSKTEIGDRGSARPDTWLNQIHEKVAIDDLNQFRVSMIKKINSQDGLRSRYFRLAKFLVRGDCWKRTGRCKGVSI